MRGEEGLKEYDNKYNQYNKNEAYKMMEKISIKLNNKNLTQLGYSNIL